MVLLAGLERKSVGAIVLLGPDAASDIAGAVLPLDAGWSVV